MKRKQFLKAIGVLALALWGCGSGADPNRPPQIRYGEDACDRCQMIINEARYAAGYVLPNGQERRFDDIGCMLNHHQQQQEQAANFWVVDYHSGEWINAKNAVFVKSSEITTPMASGIIALASRESAEEIAAQTGEANILTFEELVISASRQS